MSIMSQKAATSIWKLTRTMFNTSARKGKSFSAGNIDSSSATSAEVDLTQKQANKLCFAFAGFISSVGAIPILRSHQKKMDEILNQKKKRADSIIELNHVCLVKLEAKLQQRKRNKSKPNQ